MEGTASKDHNSIPRRPTQIDKLRLLNRQLGGRPPFRLFTFSLAAVAWLFLVLVRLWYLQVDQGDSFVEKARNQHQGIIEIRADRGVISDRFGEKLAFSTPVESIAVFPSQIQNPELTVRLLSNVLQMDYRLLHRKLERRQFQFVKRLAEPGEVERVRDLNLIGIHFEKESKRYYPQGTVASHLLGAVGVDHHGLAGLEQTFDGPLQGQPGKRLVQYDARRSRYAGITIEDPVPGAQLVLTIDQRIQMVAEVELARAIEETRAAAGTIVIMDPNNGELLAVANWPTFNPNEPARNRQDLKRRKNFAVSTLFEPGSSLKVVTIAAALEENLTHPDEVLDCEMGAIYVGRRRIRDHKPFGELTVSQILANSSNVGTVKLGLRLGDRTLHRYLVRFGFGQKTGLPLPGETAGLLRSVKNWQAGSMGSIPIGQEIGVTAIQLARAVSVIANGGWLVQPRIINLMIHPDGREQRPDVARRRRVISPKTAATMRAMMESVVRDGTGRRAGTPGYRAAGKTGTAQKVDPETRTYSKTAYVPSFVGFAPVNQPSITVVIVLDSPIGEYYGGLVAAPVFPRVVTQVLRFRDVPPEIPVPGPSKPEPPLPPVEMADMVPSPPAPRVEELRAGQAILVAATQHPGSAPRPAHLLGRVSHLSAGRPSTSGDGVSVRVTDRSVPDFRGQTVREVVSRTTALGLHLEWSGHGRARRQWPTAGTPVARGQKVLVEFVSALAGDARKR